MKKSLFLLPLLALALVACGGNSSGTSTTAPNSTSTSVSTSTVAPESTEPESVTPESTEPESVTPESVTPDSASDPVSTPDSTPDPVSTPDSTPDPVSTPDSTPDPVSPTDSTPDSESTEPAPVGLIATYDFTGLAGVGTEITDPQATLGALGEAITWTSASKVYNGNGTGGGKPNTPGMLKFGTSGEQGVLTFTVNEAVSSIVLNCHSFYAVSNNYPTNTTNYVSVNDMTPVVAPYNETADGEDVRFDLAASGTTITIKSCNPAGTGAGRILLYSISLYR